MIYNISIVRRITLALYMIKKFKNKIKNGVLLIVFNNKYYAKNLNSSNYNSDISTNNNICD